MSTLRTWPLLIVLPCLFLMVSCVFVRTTWRFDIKPANGDTVITMGDLTLVFTGVDLDKAVGGKSGGGSGMLMVAGNGTLRVTVEIAGHAFVTSYSGGLNTMTFEGHTLVLADSGTELRYAGEVYDLKDTAVRLVIAPDGTVEKVERSALSTDDAAQ